MKEHRVLTTKERFIRFLKMRYTTVLSYGGKGGTGKSLTAMNTAIRLAEKGLNVGLLDIDLEMNSIATGMGFENEKVKLMNHRLCPVTHKDYPTLKMFSLSLMPFIENGDQSILWGGEYQREYIFQLFFDVAWGKLDIMVIDAPAGISDTVLALKAIFKRIDFAVLTGLNNGISTRGVSKAITTCKENNIELLGVVANQAYFDCPFCHERSYPLGKSGVRRLCERKGVQYLGAVPLDKKIFVGMESNKPYVDSPAYDLLVEKILHLRPKLVDRGSKRGA